MLREYVYVFSKETPALAHAEPGDVLIFATPDCISGGIRSEKDLTADFDYSRANPATGPVFIEGAEPGDILAVDILNIKIGTRGVMTTLPGIGPLHDRVEARTKVVQVENGQARFNDIFMPLRPMIGVIGVAPGGDAVPCGFPGNHGGSMGCKLMREGARLHLPVRVAGGLFQLGGLHAVMGDGELCGTGLEVAGEVTVRFSLIRNSPLDWPVLETGDGWHEIASES